MYKKITCILWLRSFWIFEYHPNGVLIVFYDNFCSLWCFHFICPSCRKPYLRTKVRLCEQVTDVAIRSKLWGENQLFHNNGWTGDLQQQVPVFIKAIPTNRISHEGSSISADSSSRVTALAITTLAKTLNIIPIVLLPRVPDAKMAKLKLSYSGHFMRRQVS